MTTPNAAPTVETYTLRFRNVKDATKCHAKQATKVTFADGRVVKFMDKLSKKEAIRQAEMTVAREAKWAANA